VKQLLLVPVVALLVGAGVTTALLRPAVGPVITEPSATAAVQASPAARPTSPVVPTVSPSLRASTSTTVPIISAPISPVDEAGWVTTLPAGFAPVMPAATAELALTVPKPLSSLHLSAVVPTVYWSESQCDWLSDTMYADIQLDAAEEGRDFSAWNVQLGWWYANVVDEWQFMEGIVTQACWRGGSITGEQAATAIRDAMGDGWNGHPWHMQYDAPGSFGETWDRQWTDAYQEIATLFAQVPDAPLYYCLEGGAGDAAAASCTAASVLGSLGVAGS